MTIVDVARRAGVSTATVSRALSSPERVASSTQSRVSRVIAEVGYTPNVSARNLRTQSTQMVLALVPGLVNAFFSPILSAVEDELAKAGYGLIIGDTRNLLDREIHYSRLIRARQVDGVLILTGRVPRTEDGKGLESPLPMSLICNAIHGSSLSLFGVSNRKAAGSMTEYLIGLGHRRIGYITGPEDKTDGRERVKGFLETMEAAGFTVPREHIWKGNFFAASGAKAARQFLALRERPTAIFAANDESAIGFIQEVTKAGLSVPRDVSVAGFDDIESLELFSPGLTTMRQPRSELGRLAAIDLLQRMDRDAFERPAAKVRLDCQLIVRESVRKLDG